MLKAATSRTLNYSGNIAIVLNAINATRIMTVLPRGPEHLDDVFRVWRSQKVEVGGLVRSSLYSLLIP